MSLDLSLEEQSAIAVDQSNPVDVFRFHCRAFDPYCVQRLRDRDFILSSFLRKGKNAAKTGISSRIWFYKHATPMGSEDVLDILGT